MKRLTSNLLSSIFVLSPLFLLRSQAFILDRIPPLLDRYYHDPTRKYARNCQQRRIIVAHTKNKNVLGSWGLNMVSVRLDNDSSSSNNNNKKKKNSMEASAVPGGKQKLRKKKLQTFARYLEIECWKRADVRDLQPVFMSIADAMKQINRIVQRAKTDDLYGSAVGPDGDPLEETNVQGEVQQKLDVLCNDIMLRAFCGCSSSIHSVASEEEDVPRCCSDVMNDPAFALGDYVAVFDPLDGSKNIDASLPVGTIFGIYKPPPNHLRDGSAFLQTGRSLVASGYCLFSATTVLVITMGSGVDGFTLDPDLGQFLHTHEDIRIPQAGPIYSFNEANFHDFEEPVRRYLDALKEGSSSVGIRSNARYIGALVGDVHNILINGGIYGYPATFQNKDGKLRLMYESNPMGMIMEQAGGAASTGYGRILDVRPKDIHQRVPTYLGSIENVYEVDQFFQFYDEKEEEQEQQNNNESSSSDDNDDDNNNMDLPPDEEGGLP